MKCELVRNGILPGCVYFILKEYNLISNLELKEYIGEISLSRNCPPGAAMGR